MNQSSEPVSVTILDRKYQFSCTPDQRRDLVAAAEHLDQQMKQIREAGNIVSLERIALQAALNFSDTVLRLQRDASMREEKIDRRIRQLASQVDDALKT